MLLDKSSKEDIRRHLLAVIKHSQYSAQHIEGLKKALKSVFTEEELKEKELVFLTDN